MRRRAIGSLLSCVLLAVFGVSAVFAAPTNNPHAEFFTLECSDGETYDVVVTPGNPGHILDSTSNLIPQRFTFQLTVDGEILFEETETVGKGNKKGMQDRLISCSLELELTDEEIEELSAELRSVRQ